MEWWMRCLLLSSIISIVLSNPSRYADDAASRKGDDLSCASLPSLTHRQRSVCFRFPSLTSAALDGFRKATQECQHQFQNDRWNCSSLREQENLYSSFLLRKGYRETAVSASLLAAGMMWALRRECSGLHGSSGCDCREGVNSESNWKWAGCFTSPEAASSISQVFLGSLESGKDIHSRFLRHNHNLGRLVILKMSTVRCRCHGLSGSCEMKTCWRHPPGFREIGDFMKQRYAKALPVGLANNGQAGLKVQKLAGRRPVKRRKPFLMDMVYYEPSPTYCEADTRLNHLGTTGRVCNRTVDATSSDSCRIMCCGRGYDLVYHRSVQRCQCRLVWCCEVHCKTCVETGWISRCK